VRSEAHDVVCVRFDAKVDINFEQVVRFALHVASRVWVIRRRDFSAWKKETEFC
jgi:hypothetical protein